uniref:Fibronectin type-III domain-containing protein n=1 Tax=Macrostomum lignano TaxID=282301 RepID=A0A1I8IV68_9PLAT
GLQVPGVWPQVAVLVLGRPRLRLRLHQRPANHGEVRLRIDDVIKLSARRFRAQVAVLVLGCAGELRRNACQLLRCPLLLRLLLVVARSGDTVEGLTAQRRRLLTQVEPARSWDVSPLRRPAVGQGLRHELGMAEPRKVGVAPAPLRIEAQRLSRPPGEVVPVAGEPVRHAHPVAEPLHPVVRSHRVRVELASEAPQPVQRRRLVGSRLAIGQRLGEFLGHGGAVVLQEGLAAPQSVSASLSRCSATSEQGTRCRQSSDRSKKWLSSFMCRSPLSTADRCWQTGWRVHGLRNARPTQKAICDTRRESHVSPGDLWEAIKAGHLCKIEARSTELEARSVSETTVELDCRTSQPPTSAPALQQQPSYGGGRRLSLEFRRVDVGGGVAEEQAAWGTRLESVAQLPLQLDGLAPFTSYQARLVAWNAPQNQLLDIGEPGSFTTLERKAPPSTAPRSLTASWAAESGQTLRVSWKPPSIPNSRLTGFTLTMQQQRGESTGESPGLTHSEFVRQAPALVEAPACHAAGSSTDACRLSISLAAVNQHGAGPAARVDVVQRATAPTTARLLLQVGGALKLVAVPGPPRYTTVQFKTAAFAVDARQQLLFSVDHLGSLTRLNLTTARSESDDSIELPRVRQKVLKLAVDWVAQHVYILTKPGDILLASDWYSKVAAEEPKKIGDSPGSRDRLRAGQVQMQVDPVNGYLFLLQDGNLYRSDLPRGGLQLNWTRVPAASEASAPLSSFRVLPASQRLLLITEANSSSVLSSDLSGRGVTSESTVDGASTSQPIIRLLRLPNGRLVWTDGSMVDADRVRLRQRSGSIRELECVEPACQPKPAPLMAPELEVFCGIGGAFARVRLPGPQGEQSERQGCFRIPSMAYSCLDLRLTNYTPSTGAAAGCCILARHRSVRQPASANCHCDCVSCGLLRQATSAATERHRSPVEPACCLRRQQRNPNGTGRSLRLFAMTSTAGGFKYQLQRLEFNETSMAEPRAAVCPESSWHGHYPA